MIDKHHIHIRYAAPRRETAETIIFEAEHTNVYDVSNLSTYSPANLFAQRPSISPVSSSMPKFYVGVAVPQQ